MNWRILLGVLMMISGGAGAGAHVARIAAADAIVHRDGVVELKVTFDVQAYVLNDTPERISDGPMNELLDGPRQTLIEEVGKGRERFARHVAIFGNGVSLSAERLTFPTVEEIEKWKASGATPRLPVMLELVETSRLAAGTKSAAFRFPEVMGRMALTVERPAMEPITIAL